MTTNMTTTTSVTGSEKKQTATTSSNTESQLNGSNKVEGKKEKTFKMYREYNGCRKRSWKQ